MTSEWIRMHLLNMLLVTFFFFKCDAIDRLSMKIYFILLFSLIFFSSSSAMRTRLLWMHKVSLSAKKLTGQKRSEEKRTVTYTTIVTYWLIDSIRWWECKRDERKKKSRKSIFLSLSLSFSLVFLFWLYDCLCTNFIIAFSWFLRRNTRARVSFFSLS